MRAFHWYRNWRPWMTLNGVTAVIVRHLAEIGSFGANYAEGVEARLRLR